MEDICPFCGSTDIHDQKGRDKVHPYRVLCGECGCGTAWHGSWEGARTAWNRRSPMSPDQIDQVRSFLSRIGQGITELSHDKVRYEYLFFKQRAYELLHDIFPPKPSPPPGPVDDDF